MKRAEALYLRAVVEQAVTSLDDKTASTVATLFPRLREDGALVRVGVRINWNGVLKRAAVDLWVREDNDPDHAPGLWEDILYRDGYRIIPDVITVGLAFSAGERGWWGDVLMESIPDNNVYTPEEYAANWREVTE